MSVMVLNCGGVETIFSLILELQGTAEWSVCDFHSQLRMLHLYKVDFTFDDTLGSAKVYNVCYRFDEKSIWKR